MSNIMLEIITPEKIIFEKEVESLVLPAYEGKLGVLPKHTDMVVQIEPGELSYIAGGSKHYFALGGGYGEITGKFVRLFVEDASLAEDISTEKANQDAQSAREKVKSETDQNELQKAEAALKTALVKLKIARGKNPKR